METEQSVEKAFDLNSLLFQECLERACENLEVVKRYAGFDPILVADEALSELEEFLIF